WGRVGSVRGGCESARKAGGRAFAAGAQATSELLASCLLERSAMALRSPPPVCAATLLAVLALELGTVACGADAGEASAQIGSRDTTDIAATASATLDQATNDRD